MSGAMAAPLATLVFLSVLWLLVVLGAAVLEESGARIAAALRRETPSDIVPIAIVTRNHGRNWRGSSSYVEQRLRAAA